MLKTLGVRSKKATTLRSPSYKPPAPTLIYSRVHQLGLLSEQSLRSPEDQMQRTSPEQTDHDP